MTDRPDARAAFFGDWKRTGAAALVGLLIGGSAVALASRQAAPASEPGREEVERIVRAYLLEHPEILPQAMQVLQQRETAKLVDTNRAALETPYAGAWAGAEDGDVVLVEFFDYACGFCRASNPDVERLLKEDDGLKVVWRDLPVLGEGSRIAAEASLAAARAGRFRAFHDRLFALGRPTADTVAKARAATGLGAAPSTPGAEAEIEKNYELARALGATGTPTFVVGDQVLQGAVGYDALKQAIAEARAQS